MTKRITLNAAPSAFLIAIERANEAHWLGGYCLGKSEAQWQAIADREQAKAEAKGQPY